jgi:transcriptional regulator with XRE-family HTH domain
MARTKKGAREHAALLFHKNEGYTLKDIAEAVGVTPNTITKWKKADDWEGSAAVLLTTRHEQLKRYYLMLTDQNDMIMARPEGQRHFTKSEADAMSQTIKAIEALEKDMKLGTIIDVFTKFLKFASQVDMKQTKDFSLMLDKYIKSYDA